MTDAVTPTQQPEQSSEQQPASSTDNQPTFSLEKVYVKDLSIENPNAPDSFLEQSAPQIEIQLMNQARLVTDSIYEAVITATVTARVGEKTLYLVEASQAGVFQVRNVPEEVLSALLGIQSPTILFPYLRETVSEAIQRAGYTPVYLAPINFEAWYNEQQQQQQQQQEDQTNQPALA